MLIRMNFKGLSLDPLSNYPIAILKDDQERHALPVWVNIFEASQILQEVEKIGSPRPTVHSLLMTSVSLLGSKIDKIVINDVHQNVFYCSIHLKKRGCVLDARPADAIILALMARIPLWVDNQVIEKSKVLDYSSPELNLLGTHEDKIKSLLDHLYLSDNPKYKM